MAGLLEIKGITVGEGRPVICVPVTASDEKGILRSLREIAGKKYIQMIEWRADYFGRLDSPDAVRGILGQIEPFCKEKIVLFTVRTIKQGGKANIPEDLIIRLNETAASCKAVDLVDMELFEASKPERQIRRIHDRGACVIASHHDFERTPDDHILRILLSQMHKSGADVAKLAVMPQNRQDVLRLLDLTAETKEKYPEMPLITMSMGGPGSFSRICGELTGSCVTFGTLGDASAPGQLPAEDLCRILDIMHEGMHNNG